MVLEAPGRPLAVVSHGRRTRFRGATNPDWVVWDNLLVCLGPIPSAAAAGTLSSRSGEDDPVEPARLLCQRIVSDHYQAGTALLCGPVCGGGAEAGEQPTVRWRAG